MKTFLAFSAACFLLAVFIANRLAVVGYDDQLHQEETVESQFRAGCRARMTQEELALFTGWRDEIRSAMPWWAIRVTHLQMGNWYCSSDGTAWKAW